MITAIKDSIQNVGTRDPSWDWFGLVLSFNQCNLELGADLEGLHNFTPVHSDQCPDLAWHYSRKSRNGTLSTSERTRKPNVERVKTNEGRWQTPPTRDDQ